MPLDGASSDLNHLGGINCGRASLVNDPRFRHIAAVGAAGLTVALTNFLGVSSTEGSTCTDHFDQVSADGGPACAEVLPVAPPDGSNICTVGVPANLAPVADDDRVTQTALNQAYAVPGVLAGDSDANGDTLTAELVTGLPGLTLNTNGSFKYRFGPAGAGVPNGTAVAFTYSATDGNLDSNVATVTIALNRAGAPVAVNDAVSTLRNTPVTANVDGNDNNGGAPGGGLQQVSLTVRSQPARRHRRRGRRNKPSNHLHADARLRRQRCLYLYDQRCHRPIEHCDRNGHRHGGSGPRSRDCGGLQLR